MTNPLAGEVGFTVNGAPYTLCFSIDAFCRLEARLGLPVQDIEPLLSKKNIGKLTMAQLRTFLWAGLVEKHPDLTERMAGELIPGIDGDRQLVLLIVEAWVKAFPKAKVETPARPPVEGAAPAPIEVGTGNTSSASGPSLDSEPPLNSGD